jgi:two-component system LytT family response regulator
MTTYRREMSDVGIVVRREDPPMRHFMADRSPVASVAAPFRRDREVDASTPAITPVPPTAANGGATDVILVKTGFTQVATRIREIVYVEAARNYCLLHLENGQVLTSRVPIDRLAQHLGVGRFLRIPRGTIVNVERIRTVTALLGGRLLLTLTDGAKIAVARDRRRAVLAEIGITPEPRAKARLD